MQQSVAPKSPLLLRKARKVRPVEDIPVKVIGKEVVTMPQKRTVSKLYFIKLFFQYVFNFIFNSVSVSSGVLLVISNRCLSFCHLEFIKMTTIHCI